MTKRILFLYKAYPFALASYFRHALEKRPDVELVTCGEYFGDWIPWDGGRRLQPKYVRTVDLPLPRGMISVPWGIVKDRLGNEFDAIINVDAQFHLSEKPDSVPYAIVATDPHVLKEWYKKVRPLADYFFNMQRFADYQLGGDIWLPYACSPDHHYAMSNVEKDYDASLIGLHYEQRNALVSALRARGHKVLYDLGLIFDEYREQNNRARIGLNWSSLQDINARIFEIMAMRQIPVINRLPHLEEIGFIEGKHYLGFETLPEAVEKVEWALANPDFADAIALTAYNLVHEKHTYELRVQQMFDEMGL